MAIGNPLEARIGRAVQDSTAADQKFINKMARRVHAGENPSDADVKALADALRRTGQGNPHFEAKLQALKKCADAQNLVATHDQAVAAHHAAVEAAKAHADAPEHAPILLRAEQHAEAVAAAWGKKNTTAPHVDAARQVLVQYADLLSD